MKKPTRKQQAAATGVVVGSGIAAAAGVAVLAGAAYYFRKELLGLFGFGRVNMAPHIAAQLPIAKDLQTVPDAEGNYDMDGVSFDSEGVVVGSDKQFENVEQKQVHH